ncbi:putative 30S ribosomal protein S17 [Melia azedarach]|uniref:30S ribosomal protein S17 n=1 Tax=Melia azedarach TaxID=155640 RepID=A0ACC1Y4I2_MELAZ|nr:putative 30S ribosomal protein S17 [Melia azedarach]
MKQRNHRLYSSSLIPEKVINFFIFIFILRNNPIQQQKYSLCFSFFLISRSTTMSLTSSLQSLKLSTPKTQFLNGSTPLSRLSKPTFTPQNFTSSSLPTVRAMKTMQGRVVCATNDKTVSVEVVRLDPHPKYKRRVRKKKKFQAHDPENQFEVGDYVQLERSRPISKTKSFLAVAVPPRIRNKKAGGESNEAGNELGIPLESEQQQQQEA